MKRTGQRHMESGLKKKKKVEAEDLAQQFPALCASSCLYPPPTRMGNML